MQNKYIGIDYLKWGKRKNSSQNNQVKFVDITNNLIRHEHRKYRINIEQMLKSRGNHWVEVITGGIFMR